MRCRWAKRRTSGRLREDQPSHAGWGQTEIVTKGERCKGIKFRKCTQVKNAEGRFDPQFDDSVTEEAACDIVLYCIGQKPEYGKLLEGTKVEFTQRGFVVADPVTLQTAEKDIFVGGDVFTGQKFVIDAIAAGRQAMVSINRYVHPGQSMTIGRDLREFIELDRDDIRSSPTTTPAVRHLATREESLRRHSKICAFL